MEQKKNFIYWLYFYALPMLLSTMMLLTKTALINGITGQEDLYIAEFLLKKKYVVQGLCRNLELLQTRCDTDNLAYLVTFIALKQLIIHYGDLAAQSCIYTLVKDIQPDEIYNFGA